MKHHCQGCGVECETVYCAKCAKTIKCPHGEPIDGNCAECDWLADYQFDADREKGR